MDFWMRSRESISVEKVAKEISCEGTFWRISRTRCGKALLRSACRILHEV